MRKKQALAALSLSVRGLLDSYGGFQEEDQDERYYQAQEIRE
jgi:hypothetical protein